MDLWGGSVHASGGVGDVRLMSDASRHRVLEHETAGLDLVLDIPLRWGMGYCLNNEIVHTNQDFAAQLFLSLERPITT